MTRTLKGIVFTVVLFQGVMSAYAQTPAPDGRGAEGGMDVYAAARTGEVAVYVGGFQGNQMMAVRFGARDETDAVPCSVGVMYEYTANRQSDRAVKPMMSASLSRIFSCATDSDLVERPAPPSHGAMTIGGGIRFAIFAGARVAGSLKLLGYVERLSGISSDGDRTTRGLVVGVVIHGR